MRIAAVLAALAAISMFAIIAHATIYGSFWSEGSALWAMAWGRVSLLDLYVGFALFSGWVLFREASLPWALLCVVLVMTLGNAFAAAYVCAALVRSGGVSSRFWLGHRSTEISR